MQTLSTATSNTANREFVGSVSPKGQITLPLDVRKDLGIKDSVIIRVDQGEIKVSPAHTSFLDSFQAIPALKESLPFAEIRRIAQEEHTKEAMRPSK